MVRAWLASVAAFVAFATGAGAQMMSPPDSPADPGVFSPPATWVAPLPDFLANGLVFGAPPVETWAVAPPAFLTEAFAPAPAAQTDASPVVDAAQVAQWRAEPPAFLASGFAPATPPAFLTGETTAPTPQAEAAQAAQVGADVDPAQVAQWRAEPPAFLASGFAPATPPAFLTGETTAPAPQAEAAQAAQVGADVDPAQVAQWRAEPPAFLASGFAQATPPAFLTGETTAPTPQAEAAQAAQVGADVDPAQVAQWRAEPPAFLAAGLIPATPPAQPSARPVAPAALPQSPGPCDNLTDGANAIGRFHFFAGSARLNVAALKAIPLVAARLKQCPGLRVEVGGHADNVGSAEANMELAKRRATAIIRALEREGIEGHRLYWRSYGFSAPIASNDTPAGRALNRRIDVVVR